MQSLENGAAPAESARAYIERYTLDRATFRSDDSASTTRSFANMEDDLQKEYFGRFLIELIQNARDAWMGTETERPGGLIRITLTDEPALVVCNQGDPVRREVVIHSLAKYGESSKPHGTGIGYKGIGFKSVLEVSLTPELYSRDDSGGAWDIAVRFDADAGRRLLDENTPGWRDMLAGIPGSAGRPERIDRLPVLYFPTWVEDPEARLRGLDRLDGSPFNTAVRLPYAPRFDERLRLTRDEFVARVASAMDEITDEIVLLLGAFEEVVLENELTHRAVRIHRAASAGSPLAGGGRVETVDITRNGEPSSRWLRYEHTLDELDGAETALERTISVAVQCDLPADLGGTPRLGARRQAGAFHLFFPTFIPTHLPFLLHAYFEVDVSRTSFSRQQVARNTQLLAGLRELAVRAVRDLGGRALRGELDLRPLAALLAADDADPDDGLARQFRTDLLASLDTEHWVHGTEPDGAPLMAAPVELLVDPPVQELLPGAFPPRYLRRRLGLAYPEASTPAPVLAFLSKRIGIATAGDTGGVGSGRLRELLTPGPLRIWPDAESDAGFSELMRLLHRMHSLRPVDMAAALASLAGEPAATFIPVVADNGSARHLRAPASGARRDKAGPGEGPIMARIRAADGSELAPPPALGVDFVADGTLDQPTLDSVGTILGIRPLTTTGVLDAIQGASWAPESGEQVLRFAWRLLLRERDSSFGVHDARAEAVTKFEPGHWYWARRGRGRSATELADQRRERGLGRLLVPTRDGSWREAGRTVLGADWAEWLEALAPNSSVARTRAEAYRDLDGVGRPPSDYLASPEALAGLLPLDAADAAPGGDDDPAARWDDASEHFALLHAFLLRLGVWEVPPLAEINDWTDRPSAQLDAWAGEAGRTEHRDALAGQRIDFNAYGHGHIHVAEDYRLQWPMEATPAFIRSVSWGADLYEACGWIALYCPGCKSHTTRYQNNETAKQPSLLVHRLRTDVWVPVTVGGRPSAPVSPLNAWFEPSPPDPSRIAQSPRRFLALATPDVSKPLADLAHIDSVAGASRDRIVAELARLRDAFARGELVHDRRATGIEGQAFAGLHRELYDLLHDLAATAKRQEPEDVGGVLASLNRQLEFRPPSECRHDTGRFAPLKGQFLARVPFVVLNREQTAVASMLAVPRFDLAVTRRAGGTPTRVTELVRPLIHDRAAEFLAIQVFYPLGGQPLEPSSGNFRDRSERLATLEVFQLDNLVLDVEVEGLGIRIDVGGASDQDMFLEAATTSSPVLFHDLRGADWVHRFSERVGAHLAVLLENAAYASTFRLLLQQESRGDREAYLAELGIFDEQLDQIRAQLRTGSTERLAEERRWWNALLPMLGSEDHPIAGDTNPVVAARSVLAALDLLGTPNGTWEAVLRAGGGAEVRRDTAPSGPLARLESVGIDLRDLNDRLVRAHRADGLAFDVTGARLSAWRSQHGRHVSALLAHQGRDPDLAKAAPAAWRAPEAHRFRVAVRPAHFLPPVLADLESVGLAATADALAGDDALAYMAGLVPLTADQLDREAHLLYSEDERRLLDRDHASAFKQAVKRVMVAARTASGDLPSRIQAEADAVDAELSATFARPPDLADPVRRGLPSRLDLAEALCTVLGNWRPSMAAPSTARVYDVARELIDPPSHLDHVITVLARERRHLADKVRRDIERVRQSGVRPQVPDARVIPPRGETKKDTQRPIGPRHSHDQRRKDQLGLQAEEVVRAVVLDRLLAMDSARLSVAVHAMVDLLRSVGKGEIVDALASRGLDALGEAADEDDRVESLARFIHVAEESDDFGFDILGWVAVEENDERPLLLEVKSVDGRSFLASPGEWSRAEEQRDLFAFTCVQRPAGEGAIDLLIDPAHPEEGRQVVKETDTWRVRY